MPVAEPLHAERAILPGTPEDNEATAERGRAEALAGGGLGFTPLLSVGFVSALLSEGLGRERGGGRVAVEAAPPAEEATNSPTPPTIRARHTPVWKLY